ncbi:hypothetical protein HYPBUDRAFT_152962 [Hyphopichia burtonii NRRL Y-1933]|uniref:Uncharacterized protein n=1 Tax=Hyphopichia burtonii NRRL Y-1933 TaxID=984485 RepID=A0A1E4RI88_9ASCO|nr:hypothetical protein HYPBUDRAFT_152962 [Hyphopichia burtonii NRRL Y-1933]ODV66984.1 hypothetical protein HYPBUDRAFT_152962 [Hyphopichia burtonii NRRL Y-1933]
MGFAAVSVIEKTLAMKPGVCDAFGALRLANGIITGTIGTLACTFQGKFATRR